MIARALTWNNQGKYQVDRLSVISFKWQRFAKLYKKSLNLLGPFDASMGHGYTISQSRTAKVFPGANAFEDFPGIQVRTFSGKRRANQFKQALFAVDSDARKYAGGT